MTEKEWDDIEKFLHSAEGTRMYLNNLKPTIENGERKLDDLPDKEFIMYCYRSNQNCLFSYVINLGTVEDKNKALKLFRRTLKEGKEFRATLIEKEGAFNNEEEMKKHLSIPNNFEIWLT